MMKKLYYITLFAIASLGIKAQSAQKTLSAVFEYVSAEYKNAEGIRIIAKNAKGEVYLFTIPKENKIKNAGLLYNAPSGTNVTSSKVATTKTELVGKKIKLFYEPIGDIDPANPYCCYQITEFVFL